MMNEFEGSARRVLFVCSMNRLRSPTAMFVAQREFGWNTRSAGVEPDALILVTQDLIDWAEKVYCMTEDHAKVLLFKFGTGLKDKLKALKIPDSYEFMQDELQGILIRRLKREAKNSQ
jgi:predicted protein tyrosine phosphatase